MKESWTITKLLVAGSLGALFVLLALSGSAISAFTGIPGTSGIINSVWGAIANSFVVFLIPNFGAATAFNLAYSFLALPLPLEGTPGFLPKILIGLVVGLTVDIIYHLFRKRVRLAAAIIGFVSQYLVGLGICILGSIFRLPGIEVFQKLIFNPMVVVAMVFVMGFFGYVGFFLYRKLENTSVISRIQKNKKT